MTRTRRKRHSSTGPNPDMTESRVAEVVTVFWMLTTLATLLAYLGALAALVALRIMPDQLDGEMAWFVGMAALLSSLLMIIAAVTGLICLLFTPVVYRLRRTSPPATITAFAVIISCIPIITIALLGG